MQYALLIYSATDGSPDREQSPDGVFDDWGAYTSALKSANALLALKRLEPVDTATSVRVRGGERLVTDGPAICSWPRTQPRRPSRPPRHGGPGTGFPASPAPD